MSDHSLYSSLFPALPRAERRPNLFAAWGVLVRTLSTRRALRDLDPRLLDDIGVSREQALAEARRAPWEIGVRRPGRS